MSQDVHTPPVIASVFLKLDARRIQPLHLPPGAGRNSPHGRGRRQTGPRARQFGRLTPSTDASMTFPVLLSIKLTGCSPGHRLRAWSLELTCIPASVSKARSQGEFHENVPGK